MKKKPAKEPKNSAKPSKPSKPNKGKLRENIEALVIALIIALFIRAFVIQAFKIPTGSMENTLLVGDYLLVNKFIYGVKVPFTDVTVIPVKDPNREDIIVFRYPKDPSKDYIKRVVGIGGDTIEIRDKVLYVNGEEQKKEYTIHSDSNRIFTRSSRLPQSTVNRDNLGPVKVPKGKLFVMGDNRDHSNDSRFWGFVDITSVRGKALIIYWSWDKEKKSRVRWGRLGSLIH